MDLQTAERSTVREILPWGASRAGKEVEAHFDFESYVAEV